MSKLYHVSINGQQQDIIASNMAVAVKRALDDKSLRSAKQVRIEANLSNHGEYDKCAYHCFKANGEPVYSYNLIDRARSSDISKVYLRMPPPVIRRAEAAERMGIEAQRVLDHTDSCDVVVCVTRGTVVATVMRAGVELNADAQHSIAQRTRFAKLV